MTLTRRQFLRGAGGFTLALPFLPSLARADAPIPPRFVGIASAHGGTWQSNFCPADNVLGQSYALYADHGIAYGSLPVTNELSAVLRASATMPTAKMNVLRGIDVPFYIGHNRGSHLGNFAANDGNGTDGQVAWNTRLPTIDQVLAYSSTFYPSLAGNKRRSIQVGASPISFGWSSPLDQTGTISPLAPSTNSLSLFNSIFQAPLPVEAPRPLVVDRVVEHYRRLSQGAFGPARRLSAADRLRLDGHMQMLSELERKLNVNVPPTPACNEVDAPVDTAYNLPWQGGSPTTIADMTRGYALYNDVIAAAFMCNTSRVATIDAYPAWSNTRLHSPWHDNVAHLAQGASAQEELVASQQLIFEKVFLDLLNKLDAFEESNGKTILDNSLVMWTQECGPITHNSVDVPVVTAGSAAGKLNTGLYVDYRQQTTLMQVDGGSQYRGVSQNRWLATVLQAMGLQPSEFERPGEHGYGIWVDSTFANYQQYPARTRTDASVPLPLVFA